MQTIAFGVDKQWDPAIYIALGTLSSHLWWNMIEDNVRKRMYMCDWVTLLYSRKLTVHCKPNIVEKIKIIKKLKK